MKFTITIDCVNDAFADDYGTIDMDSARPELARLMREVADKIDGFQKYDLHQDIKDVNGNIVGTFCAKDE